MKKFTFKLALLFLINILIYYFIIVFTFGFGSECSKKTHADYDIVLLGSSHGAHIDEVIVGNLLKKNVKNIAQNAAGIIPQYIRLTCFFQSRNTTKRIVYFLDPFVLYSSRWNEDDYILKYEGIEYHYFINLLKNGVSSNVIFDYLIDRLTTYSHDFINRTVIPQKKVISQEKTANTTTKKDAEKKEKSTEELESAIKVQLDIYYNEGLNMEKFIKYSNILTKMILLGQKNNAKVTIIIPPGLLGKVPGTENVIKLLEKYKKDYSIKYYDFASEMQEQKFYYDIDHLTSDGVKYFTKHYLLKILN